jgi:hypothetical protein
MAFPFRTSVLVLALSVAATGATTASAQVINRAAQRNVSGRVMGVQGGRFMITTSNRQAQAAMAANLVGGAMPLAGGQMFQVGPATRFIAVNGSMRMPVTAAALRPGERVRVRAVGQQAMVVQILMPQNYAGVVPRYRHAHVRRTGTRNQTTAPPAAIAPTTVAQPTAQQATARSTTQSAHAHQLASHAHHKRH